MSLLHTEVRLRALSLLALSLFLLLVSAGCGADSTSAPAATSTGGSASSSRATGDGQTITITATDNLFNPKTYSAAAGKPMQLTLVNTGKNIHKVEVKGLISETELAPGQTKTLDVPNPTAGTYKIYCETHEDTGMTGEFVVK